MQHTERRKKEAKRTEEEKTARNSGKNGWKGRERERLTGFCRREQFESSRKWCAMNRRISRSVLSILAVLSADHFALAAAGETKASRAKFTPNKSPSDFEKWNRCTGSLDCPNRFTLDRGRIEVGRDYACTDSSGAASDVDGSAQR